MAHSNQIELVVTVEVDKANRSIKSVNANLSSIEATATRSAKAAASGIDGMTASIVKGATAGNLLADAIQKALAVVREYGAEIVKYAARTETLGVVTDQLARANNLNRAAVRSLIPAMKALGISTQEAHGTVQRMIFAELDLAKATQLARVAQDAAVIAGVNSSEALEKIILGITTGQTRLLHTMGLQVSLEQVIIEGERELGRALTEREKRQWMLDKVLQEGVKIHGAYEAAMETAGKQMSSLLRYWQEAKNALGAQFQDALKLVIRLAAGLSQNIEQNAAAWAKLITLFGTAAAGFAAFKFNLLGISTAITSFGGFATLLGAGAITATLYNLDQLEQRYDQFFKRTLRAGQDFATRLEPILKAIREGRPVENFDSTVEDIVRERLARPQREPWRGAESENIDEPTFRNEAFVQFIRDRYKLDPAQIENLKEHGAGLGKAVWEAIVEGWQKYGSWQATAPKIKVILPEVVDPAEQAKLAKDIARRQLEAVRETQALAQAAQEALLTGPARAIVQTEREAAKHTSYLDEKGIVHRFRLLAAARENLERALRVRVLGIAREAIEAEQKLTREQFQERLQQDSELYQARLAHNETMAQRDLEHSQRLLQFEEDRAGFERDARLRAAEAADAQTLEQKLAIEQQKAEIEIDYLEKVHQVRQRLYDLDTSRMVLEEELALKRLGYSADQIQKRIAELTQQRQEIREQADAATDAAVQTARESAAHRQTELIRDHTRQVFESLKQQAGGVFDALLHKSQSVWAAIGNTLKTAILTAMKDVITSQIAATFTRLITGQPVRLDRTGGGTFGLLGAALSWMGMGAAGAARTASAKAWRSGGLSLDEVVERYRETDPIRTNLLRALEKRTRAQAEYERILAADSQGLVDVVSGTMATVALLDPRSNLLVRMAQLASNPTWKQFQATLRSFSLEEGGAGGPLQAIGPVAKVTRIASDAKVNPEPINLLFNKQLSDLVAIGRKGGLARARNLRQRMAAADKAEEIAYSNSLYQGPAVEVAETVHQASKKIDALIPRIAGAEKAIRRTGPPFGTVREAEKWLIENLGVKRASLGSDPDFANRIIQGLQETQARGGPIPPVVRVDAREFIHDPLAAFFSVARGKTEELIINPQHPLWKQDLAREMRRSARVGWTPSADPNVMFYHEAGHLAHKRAVGSERYLALGSIEWWSDRAEATARQVSLYAAREPAEFVAEVYAGKLSGRRFPTDVEELYKRLGGPDPSLFPAGQPGVKPWGPMWGSPSDALYAAASVVGGPGGTGGFAGPVRTVSLPAAGAGSGSGGGVMSTAGLGMWGNLKANLAGWKDMLTSLGNLGFRPERWRMDEMGNMTKLAGARGVGGWQGGAMLAGGTILAMEGLRRGGWSGVGMTTAGGALIGAKFGGALGAAIGAAIGFGAGIVRLFIKGATEKAREKIKATYGVDISDKGVLRQIVDTAKQAFGGNLDMAIRTQQVRDLVQLYAMSTGQKTSGLPATMQPVSLFQQGGSIFQQSLGGLTLGRVGASTPSAAGPTVINITVPGAKEFFEKETVRVVVENPRAVQSAAMTATRANAGRRELTSLQFSPGLLTS